jgi:hypothetical protein
MPDHDASGTTVRGTNVEDANKRCPHLMGEVLIELVGVDPTDVVGLDDRVQIPHRHRLSVARTVGSGRADRPGERKVSRQNR